MITTANIYFRGGPEEKEGCVGKSFLSFVVSNAELHANRMLRMMVFSSKS
jgi:hypothetical protein